MKKYEDRSAQSIIFTASLFLVIIVTYNLFFWFGTNWIDRVAVNGIVIVVTAIALWNFYRKK